MAFRNLIATGLKIAARAETRLAPAISYVCRLLKHSAIDSNLVFSQHMFFWRGVTSSLSKMERCLKNG